jgi:aspartate aminotransferase
VAFVRALQKRHILAVPGVGFGTPGYFRLAYCVERALIEGSAPHFAETMADVRKGR